MGHTFSFIFIVYLVLLLTQPCQDMVSMVDDRGQAAEVSSIDNTPPNDPTGDACSPFCICSCCSISVADRAVTMTRTGHIVILDSAHTPGEYTSPDTVAYQNSIWQPPKA